MVKKKQSRKRKFPVVEVIVAIVFLLLISAMFIVWLTPKKEQYSFVEGFELIEETLAPYGGNFHEEILNGTMINYKDVDQAIATLTTIREEIVAGTKGALSEEDEALLLFIDIRVLMLLAEKNFIQAKTIGNKGLVTDDGFSCAEAGYIINAAYYYNLSYASGLLAYIKTDDLLNYHRNIPELWATVGIRENRTRFYFSPLDDIKKQVVANKVTLEEVCMLDVSSGFIGPVDPENYKEAPQ